MHSLSCKYRLCCSSPCIREKASQHLVHRREKAETAIERRGDRSTDTDAFSSVDEEPGAGGAPFPRDSRARHSQWGTATAV